VLILGLSTFGQNPGACLLRDGKIVAFAEEERFLRIKGANLRFPGKAITYCLKEAGVPLDAVDRIAVGWNAEKYRWQMPLFFLKTGWRNRRHTHGSAQGTVLKEILDQRPVAIRRRITLGLREAGHAGRVPAIEFVDHHLAHAASAYYGSGWDDAAILIMDGSGEERSTSLFHAQGLDLVERGHLDMPDSLGWFYAAITCYLGFKPYEEEGFTMGLAPFGRPKGEVEDKLARLLRLSANGTGRYTVDAQYTLLGHHEWNEHFSDELVELLGPPRMPSQPIEERHRDIAYAAQDRLEKAVVQLVREVTENGRRRRLCLAGGVALNCKMNGVIARSGYVDELFVQPASHDSGTALGAAMLIGRQSGDDPRQKMEHTQWGPGYSPAEVEKALQTAGARYRAVSCIEELAAEAVTRGQVVAWFDGRMEVGPRALGGRSILADATVPGMNDRVNARVKFRDPWRPFCPSMTTEAAQTLLDQPKEARFMTVAYPVKEGAAAEIPAVVHIDGTTRPQTVAAAAQPRYHRLLEAIGRKKDTAVVLNTSLNVKGEPIACTPMDAIRCFFSCGLDALAIEGFWVEKGC
jgi:carbamoyltransferase